MNKFSAPDFSKKQLEAHRQIELDRIADIEDMIEKKLYNEIFPDEKALKKALSFEQEELMIIEKKLDMY